MVDEAAHLWAVVKFVPAITGDPYDADVREGWIEGKQYEGLLSALPDYLRLPLGLGYFCGVRLSEVLSLNGTESIFLTTQSRCAREQPRMTLAG